jgi:hypothetical protein
MLIKVAYFSQIYHHTKLLHPILNTGSVLYLMELELFLHHTSVDHMDGIRYHDHEVSNDMMFIPIFRKN